jgi:hypothetical protein
LNKQKQEILSNCNLANSFLNAISNKISYCRGVIDYLNKEMYNKIKIPPTSSFMSSSPLFIFIININSDKDKNNGDK